jgi:hypothetical protein
VGLVCMSGPDMRSECEEKVVVHVFVGNEREARRSTARI